MQYVNANMQYASIAVCHAMTKHAAMPACKMSMYSPDTMYSHRQRNINLSGGGGHPKPPSYMTTALIELKRTVYKPLQI